MDSLRRGAHIVVGTPGRVMDLIEKGMLSLSNVSFATLDEADDMLRVGCVTSPWRSLTLAVKRTPSSTSAPPYLPVVAWTISPSLLLWYLGELLGRLVTVEVCGASRFKEAVEDIYKNLPVESKVQHMLWSATVPAWISELTKFMDAPKFIDLIGAAACLGCGSGTCVRQVLSRVCVCVCARAPGALACVSLDCLLCAAVCGCVCCACVLN